MPAIIPILPRKANFKIERVGDGLCNFVYEEETSPQFKEMMGNTIAAMRHALSFNPKFKFTVLKDGLGIRLVGKGITTNMACGMVVSEFLAWTKLAEMTLRELFAQSAFHSVQNAGPLPTEAQKKHNKKLRALAARENR